LRRSTAGGVLFISEAAAAPPCVINAAMHLEDDGRVDLRQIFKQPANFAKDARERAYA
jgi:hypothetical protein